jgi:phosphonoacetaldehyde hydrolase
MYESFIPLQLECLPRYCKIVPGAKDVAETLRESGVKIGVTTGYNGEMMGIVLNSLSEQGFTPDSATCASDVQAGRPAPWMIYRSMQDLNVFPAKAVVKIGDTIPDIEAGLNAGVWTIGVARTGNMVGLSEEEIQGLPDEELHARLESAYESMYRAGAHYVVDGVESCLGIIDEINHRVTEGERP